jgi:DNA-binding NtrC family response regulator
MTIGYATAVTNQSKHQLPQHWIQGWAHCAFTPQAPIAYGEGETILLAEKDATLLKLCNSLLENLNYRALTANNGAQILERCNNERIDLIVFDVEIDHQVAESQKVLAGIRRLQPAMKILLATVHDVSLTLNMGPPIEGLPVLTKPFTVQSFSRAIRQCLGDGE